MDDTTAKLGALARAQTTVAQTADGMAVSTERSSKRQLSAARDYDSVLRATDKVHRAQADYARDSAKVNRAFDQGVITVAEQARALALLSERYGANAGAANQNARATGLARHELVNLGRQAQDVGTMLAMGASPFAVLSSQGAQVFDIFSSTQGTMRGFFGQVTSGLSSMLTPTRMAFGGVVAGVGAAIVALHQYASEQQRIAMQLTGAGRATGLDVSGINGIAGSASSRSGLSVSEARNFAAELAASGRIGRESIEPLVKMGHDVAVAFGVDAAEAARMLGKAFADPVNGAETLNQRLGFLDAGMQRQIKNLVEQNRLWDAQKVLQSGMASSLADVNAAVAGSTKFWTGLGNTVSNVWDAIGAGLSRATGIGLVQGLQEQITQSKERLQELEQLAAGRSEAVNRALGTTSKIDAERAKMLGLTDAWQKYAASIDAAQGRQLSFAQAAAIDKLLPEIQQRQALNNQLRLMDDLLKSLANNEAAGTMLKGLPFTFEQVAESVRKANTALAALKSDYQMALDAQSLQSRSLTAFSPAAKGQVAFDETYLSALRTYNDETRAATLAEGARALAIKGVQVAMSEAARERELSARQGVASAQLEIDIIGRTIGQQTEMRANQQAQQQLYQEAARTRTLVNGELSASDQAQLDRIKEINAELGKRTQLAALARVNNQISFDRQTSFLSAEDVQIAQQLRDIYPNVAEGLNSIQAAGIRTNNALSGLSSSLFGTLVSGLADIFSRSKSVGQGFSDMSRVVVRAIQEMIIKLTIVGPLMRALQSGFGAWFGGGTAPTGGTGFTLTGTGGHYAAGGHVRGPGTATSDSILARLSDGEFVVNARATANNLPLLRAINDHAPRYAAGGQIGRPMAPSTAAPQLSIVFNNAPAGTQAGRASISKDAAGNMNLEVWFKSAVEGVVAEDAARNGPISKTMAGRSNRFTGS